MGRPRKTRRVRLTLQEFLRLDRALDVHLLEGGCCKAFAREHARSVDWVYKRARILGWGAVWINREERNRVTARRRYQAADPFKHAA